jgi:hypothetical protein
MEFKEQSHHVGMKSSLTLPWASVGKWIGIFEETYVQRPNYNIIFHIKLVSSNLLVDIDL